jgi:hypothetical protein
MASRLDQRAAPDFGCNTRRAARARPAHLNVIDEHSITMPGIARCA